MINRRDIVEVLQDNYPDIEIAIDLGTMKILHNPKNFKMPSDRELQILADNFDLKKQNNETKKYNLRQRLQALNIDVKELKQLLRDL